MKKYIALAALLSAGTAFANADAIDLVTTFSNAAQAEAGKVALSVAGDYGVTATVASLIETDVANSSQLSLKTSGGAGSDGTVFTPDTNVGSNHPWTATFTYTLDSDKLEVTTLDSVELGVVLFSSTGDYQSERATWTGNITFTATISAGDDTLGTLTCVLTPEKGRDSETFDIELKSSDTIDLGSNDEFTMTLALAETLVTGTFVGLKTMTPVVNGTVIPEPSAFGLLAGIGALALVASRRRRR